MNQISILRRMIETIRALIRRITNMLKVKIAGKGTVLVPKRLWEVRWNAVEILHGSLLKEAISCLESFETPPYETAKSDQLIKPIRDQYYSLKNDLEIAEGKALTHEDALRAIPTKDILKNLEEIERITNLAEVLLKRFNGYARNLFERGWVTIAEELCSSVMGLMQLMTRIERAVTSMNVNR